VASEFGSFPIVLEAVRECLQDVFDVPGLGELMGDIEARRVRPVEVTTREPSPFARSLLFGYVAQYLYEGDSPLAERRAAALSLDPRLLAELLGRAELRELLDAEVLAELERELGWLTEDRRVRDAEGVADLLRILGPLTDAELTERGASPEWGGELAAARRALRIRIAGDEHWAAIEDAGRLRDALGAALPVGVPEAFTEPVRDPLGDLLARYARTHGPFSSESAAARFGLGTAVADGVLHRLAADGRLVQGEFTPGGVGHEWCDPAVLRRLRRRSLAALRQELEPVPPTTLAAFLPQWQHAGSLPARGGLRGVDGLLRAVEQLQGAPVPASALERLVLPSRVSGYAPPLLDELTAAGEVVWAGAGALPGTDGWISLYPADTAPLLLPPPHPLELSPVHRAVLDALSGGYGLFFRQIAEQVRAAGHDLPDARLAEVVWELAWSGRLTNDTLSPLRSLLGSGRTAGATAHRARRATPRGRYGSLAIGAGGPGRAPASQGGPPTVAGRWSLLPEREDDVTLRAHALARTLLDRHGVVTRGAVAAEGVEGGFAAAYRVLSAFEETGQARRGYVVEGLGAAQFAMDGAVDRLRAISTAAMGAPPGPPGAWGRAAGEPARGAVVLAAADPANAYGAALPWPEPPRAAGHKPGRKAGALVVLVGGELSLYVERGGRTLLAWAAEAEQADPEAAEASLRLAGEALAQAVRQGAVGTLTVERVNGSPVLADAFWARLLEDAGFHPTPRGLRLRP
jgi:ATP-dependent helicase Lhr and Lhr-like helicase